MSKLTWHFQQIPGDVAAIVRASPARYVKIVDPPGEDPFPGKRVIGRTYCPGDDSYAMRGSAGAADWFNRWLTFYQARPYVHAWEGPNEPDSYAPGALQALSDFYATYADLMHAAGLRVAGLVLGEGHPPEGQAHKLAGAVRACDYLTLHEYGAPEVSDGAPWHILRYRATVAELQAAGIQVPPLLLTEIGIDGGVLPQAQRRPGGQGWRTYTTQDRFLEGLRRYSSELDRDPIVEAAFLFTSGPYADWTTFDVGPDLSRALAALLAADPPPPVWDSRPQSSPDPQRVILDVSDLMPAHKTARWSTRPLSAIQEIIVHHTAVEPKATDYNYVVGHLQAIARGHIRWGDPTIAYHILIAPDGTPYRVNPDADVTWHSGNAAVNVRSIGICLLGALHKHPPTPAQLDTLHWLKARANLPWRGHKEIVPTQCPGTWWPPKAA